MALAFMQKTYTVYSDDVIALRLEDEKLMMYPCFPRLRVNQDTIISMKAEPKSFEFIDHFPTKLNSDKKLIKMWLQNCKVQSKTASI